MAVEEKFRGLLVVSPKLRFANPFSRLKIGCFKATVLDYQYRIPRCKIESIELADFAETQILIDLSRVAHRGKFYKTTRL
jgi:hypothetical protein